jgi:hypothetical protein
LLPDVKSTMIEFRLIGTCKINKPSLFRVSYLYRFLTSTDWQWDPTPTQ